MIQKTRLSKRKAQIVEELNGRRPKIATLNELRVRSYWEVMKKPGSRSLADHRKSFTRTVLEHGEPLTVYDLSRTYEGIPVALTTGIFARWAIWEFIERGYLTDLPGAEDIILYMGCDACTGLVRVNENLYSITGTSCYLRSLYLVSLENDYELLKSFSKVEWPILGAKKDGTFRQINNDASVYELGLLPSYTSALNGKHLSLAKISFRY